MVNGLSFAGRYYDETPMLQFDSQLFMALATGNVGAAKYDAQTLNGARCRLADLVGGDMKMAYRVGGDLFEGADESLTNRLVFSPPESGIHFSSHDMGSYGMPSGFGLKH